MTLNRPRATGYYAKYLGREYHAAVKSSTVILRSYQGEPEAVDFKASRIPMVQGVKAVQRSELEQLSFVRTVCQWNGEPFLIVGVHDANVYVF
jgi:hypothetical protein